MRFDPSEGRRIEPEFKLRGAAIEPAREEFGEIVCWRVGLVRGRG